MSLIDRFRARFSARPDSEHEQAILRIVIVGAIWAYMGLLAQPASAEQRLHDLLVQGLAVFFAIALAIFACIAAWPAPNVPRRVAGMVADTAGATFYMFLGEAYGASMIAVFLFVTFGNGFRFGRRHLFACQALSLVGLSLVLLWVPFWQANKPIGMALLISLIVLPLYVSTLLKRIQEARQRAEEANIAKTSFLANMSHEMRTPLNGIVGVADLLTTTSLTHQQSELVSLLGHSVKVLRSLIDDVLDIAKIEAGRLTIERLPFDPYLTVLELLDVLRPHAEAKQLRLNAQFDPSLAFRLIGDPHHLRQVLLNLLGNAIKFTDKGEVCVRVRRTSESDAGVRARFEVRDTGIGISPDALPSIFDRFVQADQSTTRRFGGTGLGTTIAKQLVEHMGGTIGVESVVGAGSTFWFELPFELPLGACADSFPDSGHEDQQRVAVVIANQRRANEAIALFERAGEPCSVVSTVDAASAMIADLRKLGHRVRCLASYEFQGADLKSMCGSQTNEYPALIALTDDGPPATEASVSIGAVTELNTNVSASVIANVVHAATLRTHLPDALHGSLATILEQSHRSGTILVADDNVTNQTIIRELLCRAGYRVVLAMDGEQALDVYEANRPDLALLDFNMPHRNGCEVIQAIRHMEAPQERMPAIILSASVTPESRDRATASGADAFVGKPFEPTTLLRTIDELIQNRNAENRASRQAPARSASKPASDAVVSAANGDFARDAAATQRLINWARVAQLEDIARNQYFVAELLRGFRDDGERLLVEIQLAVNSDDRVGLEDSLHALKGAAVGVGASTLMEKCKYLEESIRKDATSRDQLARCPADLRTVFAATIKELDAYMMKRHNVSMESH